jgi:Fic family protein
MLNFDGDLSLGITLKWHKELFGETKKDLAGKLRYYRVYISGSMHKPPPPEEVEMCIDELFKWYSRESKKMNAVELAALLHLKFETIHPFGDGNGRIGRMIMNFVLHHNGYPMLDIRYINRMDYYKALEKSNVREDETAFVQWFFKRYVKENGGYLKVK